MKRFIVLQEGWDPNPDPKYSRPRWIRKEELAERYGLDWRAELRCVIGWNPRRSFGCPVPYEEALILGPRFGWGYRLPEEAVSVLERARLELGRSAMGKEWKGLFPQERMKPVADHQNKWVGGAWRFAQR